MLGKDEAFLNLCFGAASSFKLSDTFVMSYLDANRFFTANLEHWGISEIFVTRMGNIFGFGEFH
jgi:hypothetical protein